MSMTSVTTGARLRERLANIYELCDTRNAQRNLPMEGLRGLAVTLVFFVHYHALFKVLADPASTTFAVSNFLGTIGLVGVDLFFVLSGYLIYGLIFAKPTRYATFIKRRIQRIYPTFLFVLAVYILLSALFPAENKIPSEPLSAAFYILQNVLLLPGLLDIKPIITVAWSLSYEFFYYLLIPFLVVVLGMRRWARSLRVLFFLAVSALYTIYCMVGAHSRIHLLMFVSGILLFEAMHTYGVAERGSTRLDYVALFVLLLTFPLIYAVTDRPDLLPFLNSSGEIKDIYRVLILYVSFWLFTLCCFRSRSLLKRMFSWTPLRWLGNMSYSYYLIHALTLKGIALVVLRISPPAPLATAVFWVGLPVFFFMTLVSSTLLFITIEKRFSISRPASRSSKSDAAPGSEGALAAAATVAHAPDMNVPQLGGGWPSVPESERLANQ
ncbi:MAG TPA: acyltransferase [Pyrinomonadaceae bacterium]|jgi:peptidoglycan/LPS O-acetylase OafA/YrhL|nr:acyltransferase [Pyrinomonadaceae bacterium]